MVYVVHIKVYLKSIWTFIRGHDLITCFCSRRNQIVVLFSLLQVWNNSWKCRFFKARKLLSRTILKGRLRLRSKFNWLRKAQVMKNSNRHSTEPERSNKGFQLFILSCPCLTYVEKCIRILNNKMSSLCTHNFLRLS